MLFKASEETQLGFSNIKNAEIILIKRAKVDGVDKILIRATREILN